MLVILGLLTGGILAGKSLIHASELRSVTADFKRYQSAMMAFRDKYFYYPGDLPNATSFWGDDASYCADAAVTDGTPGTCNGNGDGALYGIDENLRAWQQLELAGMIEGQYTGQLDTTTGFSPSYLTVGKNIPASKIGGAGYIAGYGLASGPSGVTLRDASGANITTTDWLMIDLIKPLSASGGTGPNAKTFWGAISHEDAWNLDTKMDDGVAATGRVMASFVKSQGSGIIGNMTCLTYDLSNTTDTCALAYIFKQ